MTDTYMKEQGEALANHLRLNDGKSGYVEVTAEGFHVYVRKKFSGKQFAEWDGLPVTWHENVGTHKASGR